MPSLRRRVADAAEAALAQRKYVTAIDVFAGVGWLRSHEVDRWRQGRVATLSELAPVDAQRLRDATDLLAEWARERGLTPSEAAYLSSSRDREPLRFVTDGDHAVFRTHWMSPGLAPARREQLIQRQNRTPDLMVVVPASAWTCVECADTGPYLIMSSAGPLCLTCADLDHLVFLAAGDAALSRRAKKESTLAAVVVEFNPRRKRHERRGILVEERALARAEEQCLADEEVRLRRRDRDRIHRAAADVEFQDRFADGIRGLFPHCPPERATVIAAHAAVRGSGRVGRSAAAKVLDPEAITLAVIASIRHLDTDYDRLLMQGTPRADARVAIRADVDRMLESWRG